MLGVPVFLRCTHTRLNANVTQKPVCTVHCKEEGIGAEKSASCFHQAGDNEPFVQPPSDLTSFSATKEPVVLQWLRRILFLLFVLGILNTGLRGSRKEIVSAAQGYLFPQNCSDLQPQK